MTQDNVTTKEPMPELKPCPFCGGEKFKEDWDGVTTIYGVDHQTCELICENCNVSFWIPCTNHIDDNTREDMTAKWNTRAASVPSDKERAEALEAIRHYFSEEEYKTRGSMCHTTHCRHSYYKRMLERCDILSTPDQSEVIDKLVEAANASIAAFKAAYADIGAAEKIINSGHSDRMQMEVTKQRLSILIDMNEQALALARNSSNSDELRLAEKARGA